MMFAYHQLQQTTSDQHTLSLITLTFRPWPKGKVTFCVSGISGSRGVTSYEPGRCPVRRLLHATSRLRRNDSGSGGRRGGRGRKESGRSGVFHQRRLSPVAPAAGVQSWTGSVRKAASAAGRPEHIAPADRQTETCDPQRNSSGFEPTRRAWTSLDEPGRAAKRHQQTARAEHA